VQTRYNVFVYMCGTPWYDIYIRIYIRILEYGYATVEAVL